MLLSALLLLASCMGGGADSFSDLEPVTFRYASLLKVSRNDSVIVADIMNPWAVDTTAVLHHYEIKKPFRNTVVYTSVHSGLFTEMGCLGAISGLGDTQYINLPVLREGLEKGTIKDCGGSMEPNIEAIIDLRPDAIFLSPFENAGSYGKVGKLGIPIVECADYMEHIPLGRAEWMRFYGMLLGCEEEADSLFAQVEGEYLRLKEMVKNGDGNDNGNEGQRPLAPSSLRGGVDNGNDSLRGGVDNGNPTVLTEMKIGNTWYVAGNDSYVGNMIRDAGGRYVFSSVEGAGAQPYSPEEVFDVAQQADVWMFKYSQETDKTLQQLAEEWPNNNRIKAWQTKNTYGCNLLKNAFFEETPFHPDVLLKDFITIFHPGIIKGHSLRYYKKLK